MNRLISVMALSLFLTMTVTAYSGSVQSDLQNNIVRLHIIANSDSDEDQAVKLRIRDTILREEGERVLAQNKQDCIQKIKNDLPRIEEIANRVLAENGFHYSAKAVYGKFDFPKKEYKNITLPCGEYYGVRIILGNGEGHNWWCVMYPPVCMMSDSEAALSEKSKKVLKENLRGETYDVITGENIEVKFRVVEAVQEIKQIIGR